MLVINLRHCSLTQLHCHQWESGHDAGLAVNQSGRSSGLTAPSGPAQTTLMQAAMAVARVTIHDIALISLHGTGTPLGDPIEVGALGTTTNEPVQLCTAPLVLGAAFTLSLSSQLLRWACKACQYDMQEQKSLVSWMLHILEWQNKHV